MRTGRPQPASYCTAARSARIGAMRSVITRWCSTMGGTVPARRAGPRRWVRPCPKHRSGCFRRCLWPLVPLHVRCLTHGEVGRWLSGCPVWPAAPCRTVRAVLPHTALRHRSPSGMRSPIAHRAAELVDPEALVPGVAEPAGPVAATEPVFGAGEDGEPFVDVAVDGGELPARIAPPEVVTPPPQHGVEASHNLLDRPADEPAVGAVTHLRPNRGYGPIRRPSLQVVPARTFPRRHLVMVKAEKVKALPTTGQVHDPGFVRMQPQPEPAQYRDHPLPGRFGPGLGGAQHDKVVGEPDQHPQMAAVVAPVPIEDRQRHIGQQRRNHAPNAMDNFCFEVTLSYRRLERPWRVPGRQ